MNRLTLQDVQSISLEIMKNLHAFCIENHIKYSIAYGSLIGAIRHKGFIPWDDDMDVVMMREDYDRFCQLYEDNDNYKLFSYNRKNMYAPLARLCDIKHTLVKPVAPLFTEDTGIWVDIFPLDSVDDDKQLFERKITTILEYYHDNPLYRWNTAPLINKLKHPGATYRGIKAWLRHRYSIQELLRRQQELILSFASHDSGMMSNLSYPIYIKKDYCPKQVFDSVIEVPFEDTTFMAMSGYDQWLRLIYGDYMQLPPEEKRVAGHNMHQYFWK